MRFVSASLDLKVPDILVENYSDLLAELIDEANRLQPPYPGEFNQRDAAIHEASHCVVAAREGMPLRIARIRREGDVWGGEWWSQDGALVIDVLANPHDWLAHLRVLLAGRRGELLFQPKLSLRVGLDELAYALIMVMWVFPALNLDAKDHYTAVWKTTLIEVDETLRAHKGAVYQIADELMRRGAIRSQKLAAAVASVPRHNDPPRIRDIGELSGIAHDPLAHGLAGREDAQ
jgi:hypothetical protein